MPERNQAADSAKSKSDDTPEKVDSHGLDPGPIEVGFVMKHIGQDNDLPVDLHLQLHVPSSEGDDDNARWDEK
jgi:hypothetical protein